MGEGQFHCDESDIATETCLGKKIELITAFFFTALHRMLLLTLNLYSILAPNVNLALNFVFVSNFGMIVAYCLYSLIRSSPSRCIRHELDYRNPHYIMCC